MTAKDRGEPDPKPSGIGLFSLALINIVAIVVGFFPPTQFGALQIDSVTFVGLLLVGMWSVMALPVGLHGLRRRAIRAHSLR